MGGITGQHQMLASSVWMFNSQWIVCHRCVQTTKIVIYKLSIHCIFQLDSSDIMVKVGVA